MDLYLLESVMSIEFLLTSIICIIYTFLDSEDFHNLNTESLETELKNWKIPNFEDLCEELKFLF